MIPPSVFVGNLVNFVGRFMTYNEGKSFWVVDALPFEGVYRQIVGPAHNHILGFCDDPRDWLEKEAMEHLHLRDPY